MGTGLSAGSSPHCPPALKATTTVSPPHSRLHQAHGGPASCSATKGEPTARSLSLWQRPAMRTRAQTHLPGGEPTQTSGPHPQELSLPGAAARPPSTRPHPSRYPGSATSPPLDARCSLLAPWHGASGLGPDLTAPPQRVLSALRLRPFFCPGHCGHFLAQKQRRSLLCGGYYTPSAAPVRSGRVPPGSWAPSGL